MFSLPATHLLSRRSSSMRLAHMDDTEMAIAVKQNH